MPRYVLYTSVGGNFFMTFWTTTLIIVLTFLVQPAMAQDDFFDKSVRTKIKPNKEEFLRVSIDTLSDYFDSLHLNVSSVTNHEIYRVTLESFEPRGTTVKYFILSNQTLTSIEVFNDRDEIFARRRSYGEKLVAKFRPLIDSTYWNYREPTNQDNGLVHDGGRTKIEGLRNLVFKEIERVNPTKYDTLFRLPESFFRKY